ncbi:hypothetical protein NC796_04860 [Aliifodinibius sp. S!AR15-10]|uniref:hypothetical protein n=1 Tax=Aliifodinibius sp. S!AR15-10 TaxID=2950437 RepID=UPI0028630FAC|nr:hypothetical protein [Aliifodinibius sp. S!AR15-10]MDR8390461.1 hypothetical protein [Aliifodinibius sp. S!AR15-10]
MTHSRLFKTSILLIVFNILAYPGLSQGNSNEKLDVSGSISVMNEGISTVPSLALGEPAAIFNLSIGKRFRFEPELRFSLEGKPWSFLFWFRYDIVNHDKFSFRIGAHPAYSFRTVPALIDETNQYEEIIEARRFLAGDLNTSYSVTENFDVGFYYLGGHGFESSVPDQTHYLSLYSSIPNISLFNDLYMNLRPQVYYLKIDEIDGFYVASSIALGMIDIPFTFSTTINKVIDSEIENDDPLWNISLNYSFRL